MVKIEEFIFGYRIAEKADLAFFPVADFAMALLTISQTALY